MPTFRLIIQQRSKTMSLQRSAGGFYKSEDKVILIERYTNSEAMIKHAQNVSPEGVMHPQFVKFMEHFEIQKIDVYGDASEAMKAFVEPFNLPFVYHSAFASFSRN